MGGYTKLFQSIIHSTIWQEPDHVRLVWVTMLAMSDAHGVVEASVPGLADVARVAIEQCVDALQRFQKPDEWSRNKTSGGRRIEEVAGGWRLLNHKHYRDLLSAEQRREKDAERKRNERASAKRPSPSENVREVAHSEAAPDPTPDPTPEAAPDPGDPPVVPQGTKPKRPRTRTRLPDDFQPRADHRSQAEQLGVSLQEQFPKFVDYHRAKGSLMADWGSALRTWLGNAKSFQRGNAGQRGAFTGEAMFERIKRIEEQEKSDT